MMRTFTIENIKEQIGGVTELASMLVAWDRLLKEVQLA
jgi:hypothetical protein